MAIIYGYARCSTNESKQDINRQYRKLKYPRKSMNTAKVWMTKIQN